MSLSNKSVVIKGDKSLFLSKSALERFKNDLKNNNDEKLKLNNYLKSDIKYELDTSKDNEIVVNLISSKVQNNITSIPVESKEHDEKMKVLKDKLRSARINKMPLNKAKLFLKNKVPDDILDAYMDVKKLKVNLPIPPPDEIFNNPEQYKSIIEPIVQTFSKYNNHNHPIIKYYKLLAEKLNLNVLTPQQAQQQQYRQAQQRQQAPQTEEEAPQLQEITDRVNLEVDEEMKKIYDSLGISSTVTNNKENDDMKKIYESLGITDA
jgi:hypothetical protein